MRFYNENDTNLYWCVYNPADTIYAVPLRDGVLAKGQSSSYDHPNGPLKFALNQNDRFGGSCIKPGPVYPNGTAIVMTNNGFIQIASGLQIDDQPDKFSAEQAKLLASAFGRIANGLDQCCALDEERKNKIKNKLNGGIVINQDDIFAQRQSWAESKINGNTITVDTTQTWTPQRLPQLAATLAHEFIHLIGENHIDPAVPYVDTVFHKFELCFS